MKDSTGVLLFLLQNALESQHKLSVQRTRAESLAEQMMRTRKDEQGYLETYPDM